MAELSHGFGGRLANDQVMFMVLDGAMMTITVIVLTIGHPGPALGTMWKDGAFRFRKSKFRHVFDGQTELNQATMLSTRIRGKI